MSFSYSAHSTISSGPACFAQCERKILEEAFIVSAMPILAVIVPLFIILIFGLKELMRKAADLVSVSSNIVIGGSAKKAVF